MAEYLAPGVYVKEFTSGAKAMEGVSTSTAGFVGVTQRGPLIGKPVLVTSFAEYRETFGTYLSSSYGEQRYLPYSVEQFFNNGGSSAYIMRVARNENNYAIDPSVYLGVDMGSGKRSGLAAFHEISDISIICIPGITLPSVQTALIAFCEARTSCIAILDIPFNASKVDDLILHRSNYDSSYGAIYHPWLGYFDALEKRNFFLPPSGIMAGIYARCDNERGVHKAPTNVIVRGCTSLSNTYNEAEQGKLNLKGVNLIRAIPGYGIRVWGAVTMSADVNMKYINIRRLFIYMEESIRAYTSWAVFEPNDDILWSRVQGTITMFLATLWRNGALAGKTPEEAFFVNVGKTTMTQDDILNGCLICEIGAAPARPSEFEIFRITQKMEDAQ